MAASRLAWSNVWRRAGLHAVRGSSLARPSPVYRASALSVKLPTRLSVRYASQSPWPRPRYQYSRFGQDPSSPKPTSRIHLIWNNYRGTIIVVGGVCFVFYVYNLETVQISGRRRFNFLSPEMEARVVEGQYEEMVQELRPKLLPSHHPATQLAHGVVTRLVHANGLEGQKWVVHVVQDDTANAFCMPGGQIFVFTGILPYTQDEEGLAAVLGHEIAHKVARHHAEQMSAQIWAFAFVIAATIVGDVSSDFSRTLYNLLFNLRNSRTQEAEADQLGLLMMARSCYDPHSAVTYWNRMVQMEHDKRQSIPQFMSTHPASESRVKHIEALVPQAMEEAEKSNCNFTKGAFNDFRNAFPGGNGDSVHFGEGGGKVAAADGSGATSDNDWF